MILMAGVACGEGTEGDVGRSAQTASPELIIGQYDEGGGIVYRYPRDRVEEAERYLEHQGLDGAVSRYESGDLEDLRRLVTELEFGPGERVGTRYDAETDMFQLLGQIDESKLSIFEDYEYEYVPSEGGRGS